MTIQFVGDLSIQDAKILARLGLRHSHILEFGVGGSTQIFAQCQPEVLVSVETDLTWIERTRANLAKIDHDKWTKPEFVQYDMYKGGQFDLIFVDGIPSRRLEFAMRAWPDLIIGGRMIFHDTRRFEYFREAAWVMQSFFGSVRSVEVNIENSNLTIIEKGVQLDYQNWNETEGKPAWAYGKSDIPQGRGLWKLES